MTVEKRATLKVAFFSVDFDLSDNLLANSQLYSD